MNMEINQRERRRAVGMLLLATVGWGLSFPLIKGLGLLAMQVAPTMGSGMVTALTVAPRFALALALLALVRPGWFRGITRIEWRQGIGLGVFATGGTVLQNDGLLYTTASTSAFLTQLYAVMIPVWLAVRTRRNPGGITWVAVALVLAGVAVLARFDGSAMSLGRGELETLACAVFFMGQILWLELPEFRGTRAGTITVVMFAVQAVAGLGLMVALGGSAADVAALASRGSWWGLTLTLTVGCTIGPVLLMNLYQPWITSTEAGLIYSGEPIFGSLLAGFLPGLMSAAVGIAYANETLTTHLALGGGLITAANVAIQLYPPRQPTLAPVVATPVVADPPSRGT